MVAPVGIAASSAFVALEQRIVGGYRLERPLGRGGMGEVWLGRHLLSHGLAAVKMIKPGAVREALDSFFQTERRAIARLCHPNIVGLYDLGPDFMICQYVDGTDLAHRLRSPLMPSESVHIALQVASALAHAHELGVIHRDVKPSNVLLDRHGNAYLADFGVARIVDDLEPDERVVGTPAYMAPEQELALATPASDQYSLGRTLLVMLAGGRVPIDPASALEALPDSLPAALRDVIARATHPEWHRRFPSVRAFAEALGAIDLDGFPRAVPYAPQLRAAAPFAWCRAAHSTQAFGHDILRADYRLSELGLPDEDVAALRELSGFADMGFAVFGRTARLGAITDPQAFARATEVVVLLHGFCGSRETWRHVAGACCRTNGQAIVIAPDIFGFGESRYREDTPPRELIQPERVPRIALAFLSLLGLADVPTVMVAHSAAATGVLAAGDAEIPPHVSRVALTPVFSHLSFGFRVQLYFLLFLIRLMCLLRVTQGWLARVIAYNAATRTYSDEEKERMRVAMATASGGLIYGLYAAFGRTVPARGDRLRRTMIVLVDDDPLAPAASIAKMLRRDGFPEDKIYRLGRGAHFPHQAEDFVSRNINDIATAIDAVLDGTRVGPTAADSKGVTVTI